MCPGKKAEPLGQISLEVIFGSEDNFRAETLCFEVVPFKGGYHALLGCPAFVKFMAIPFYTYMKLKMLGPHGVITVSGDPKNALEAKVANLEHIEAELACDGEVETSTTTEEVAIMATKKPCPGNKGLEAWAPPTDPSGYNWETATPTCYKPSKKERRQPARAEPG